jgi:hypothetical protein
MDEALPPYIYGRETGPNEKVWTEQAIRTALAAQQQRIAELERDSGRYRWLRDRSTQRQQEDWWPIRLPEDADAYADAAMAREGKP